MFQRETLESIPVFESHATYYNPVSKHWNKGTFTLNKGHLQFVGESKDDNQFHLSLPFNTVSSIEKRQSSFIYAAVVVNVGSEKHWFASFHNRDTVYNLLELFWREALLSKTYMTALNSPKILSNSTLGKQLLNHLYDSENILISTANSLVDEGNRLHDALESVEEMNNDLEVAEKLIKTVSFIPSVAGPSVSHETNAPQVQDETGQELETPKRQFKVTFSFPESSKENINDWAKGKFVISDDLMVVDEKGHACISISRNDLKCIQVISPWELCIKHENNGNQKCLSIMCPQLSSLLRFLSSAPELNNKVIFENEATSLYTTPCSSTSSMASALSTLSLSEANSPTVELPGGLAQQIQGLDAISDEEVEEITNVLSNLQALAIEVFSEQQAQMDKINSLLVDIDKTVLKLNENTKAIKKLP